MATGIKQLAVGRKDVFMVNPADLVEEPGWNARENCAELEAHIRSLADSIKGVGVQQPLTAYMRPRVDNKDISDPVVTDGHCRLMAVNLAISEGAEIKAVPVRVEDRYANEADRTLSLLTRNSGKPLSIPEQAQVVKRLLNYGWTTADIRAKTGHTPAQMGSIMTLLSATSDIQEMVKAGKVSPTAAVNQIRKDGEGAGQVLRAGVARAQAEGKQRATAKHIEPKKKIDLVRPIEDYAGTCEPLQAEEILMICKRLREVMGLV